MIQRIQTLFMFLAVIAMTAGFYLFPIITDADSPVWAKDDVLYMILGGAIAGIAAANNFNYRKRQLQIVLNRLNIILAFVLTGLFAWKYLSFPEGSEPGFGLGGVMPLISVVLLVLANRAILKDEMLVRAADRLR